MNRAMCSTGVFLMLLTLAGCRSSIFSPNLGSQLRLPTWAGGKQPVPDPPDSLDGPDTGRAVVGQPDQAGQPGNGSDIPPGKQSTTTRLAAGREAFNQGRLTTAASHLNAVLDNQPKHVEAHHLMAIITGRRHNYSASDRHFETAIAQAPNNANLLSDYGYSKLRRFDLNSAEQLLTRALKIEPDNSFALNNLGTVLARQGRYDDALQTLRQAGSESDAQAKIAQLFPRGRPAIQDLPTNTAANTAPVTADSPRSLPGLTNSTNPLDPPLTPRRILPDPSATTTQSNNGPLVPSSITATEPLIHTAPPNPLADSANLPSRPIPWNASDSPLTTDTNPITPASATLPTRRINREFSRNAARLGLGIGPGSLVPAGATGQPAAISQPPTTTPAPAFTTPPPPTPISSADPLSEFEKELQNNTAADRNALRQRLTSPINDNDLSNP